MMKKLLFTILFLLPTIAFGTTAANWSTNDLKLISPNLINGVSPAVKLLSQLYASSTALINGTTTIGDDLSSIILGKINISGQDYPLINCQSGGFPLCLFNSTQYTIEDPTQNTDPSINLISYDLLSQASLGLSTSTNSFTISSGNIQLNPTNLLTISSNGTTTANHGIDISDGCFAINGACVSGGSGTNYWTYSAPFLTPASSSPIASRDWPFYSLADSLAGLFMGSADGSKNALILYSTSTDSVAFSGATGGYTFDNGLTVTGGTSTFDGIKVANNRGIQFIGYASLPQLFAADPTTGVHFDGPGILSFHNGGVQTMLLNALNNVGIGKTPSTKLDVEGTASSTGLQVNGNATTTNIQYIGNSAGIGTTTIPATLTIQATTNISPLTVNATSGNPSIPLLTISSSTGFVGIGTNNPQRGLVIADSANFNKTLMGFWNKDTTDNNGAVFSFRGNTTGAGATEFREFSGIRGQFIDHNDATRKGAIKFFVQDGSNLRFPFTVNYDGNVGVGTQTPQATLAVDGDVKFQGNNFATTTIGDYFTNFIVGGLDGVFGKLPMITPTSTIGPIGILNGGWYIKEYPNSGSNPALGFISDDLNTSASLEFATSSGLFTINSGQLGIQTGATTTSNTGFDISTGCYAIGGICIGESGSGTSGDHWATSTDDSTAIVPAGATKIGLGTTTPQTEFENVGTTTSGAYYGGARGAQQWQMINRAAVGFPVPVLAGVQRGQTFAFDLSGGGATVNNSNNGVVWQDNCDDIDIYGNTKPMNCARVGGVRLDTYVEFGSRAFNGAQSLPVALSENGTLRLFIATTTGKYVSIGGNRFPNAMLDVYETRDGARDYIALTDNQWQDQDRKSISWFANVDVAPLTGTLVSQISSFYHRESGDDVDFRFSPFDNGVMNPDTVTFAGNGNVGIATTTPTNFLTVEASTTNAGGITVTGKNDPAITLSTNSGIKGYLGIPVDNNAFLTPARLGDIILRVNAGVGRLLLGQEGYTPASFARGFLGIGTSSPEFLIDGMSPSVAATAIGTEPLLRLYRAINTNNSYPQAATFALGTWDTNSVTNGYGPATRLDLNLKASQMASTTATSTIMTWLDNGRVGVGTTSPFKALSVVGDILSSTLAGSGTRCVNADQYGTLGVSASNCLSTSDFTQSQWATTTAGDSIIPAGAIKVGIGSTTPFSVLSVSSTSTAGLVSRLFTVASGTNATIFTVLSNGRVGIGTTTPQTAFDASGTSTFRMPGSVTTSIGSFNVAGPKSLIVPSDPTSADTDILGLGGSSVYITNAGINHATEGEHRILLALYDNKSGKTATMSLSTSTLFAPTTQLQFDPGSSNSINLNVTNGGVVGVGSSSPWATLSVNGLSQSAGQPSFVVGSSTKTDFIIDQGGNVGIGTTSPVTKLSVTGSGYLTAGLGVGALNTTAGTVLQQTSAQFTGYTLSNGTNNIAQIYGTAAANDSGVLQLSNAGVANVQLSAGNGVPNYINGSSVGIGTTTPAYKLQVAGSAAIGSIKNSKRGIYIDNEDAYGNAPVIQGLSSTFGGSAIAINPTGDFVGIGTTTPKRMLTIWKSGNRGELAIMDNAAGVVDSTTQGGTYLSSERGLFKIQGMNSQGSGSGIITTVDQVNTRYGVATDTPWRTLSVTGTVAFDGLTSTSTPGDSLCLSNKKDVTVRTNNTCSAASSIRFKQDIKPLTVGLDALLQLKPITYSYKDDYIGENRKNDPNWTRRQEGFIAEEVNKIDPLLVTYDNTGKVDGIHYDKMTALIVKSIQELANTVYRLIPIIKNHNDRITKLEKENAELKVRLLKLEAKVK